MPPEHEGRPGWQGEDQRQTVGRESGAYRPSGGALRDAAVVCYSPYPRPAGRSASLATPHVDKDSSDQHDVEIYIYIYIIQFTIE